MRRQHILIVDDDSKILKLIKQLFILNNFLVSTAENTFQAEKYLKYFIFNLLILDIMLPHTTGLEFANKIKSQNIKIPIILLTALSSTNDRIKGLESKVDDYITKPFEPKELILRARNLIDLYAQFEIKTNDIYIGNCCYNQKTKQLTKNKQDIYLSDTEQKLLELFLQNNNQILTRERLSVLMGELNSRSIDVQIARLRNKIEDDSKNPKYIKTIRHQGYLLYL